MPIKTSTGKWKWGNIERSSKKELAQTVYGIWKKNGSKGTFSDFWHGTHNESLDEAFELDTTKLYFHGSLDKGIRKLKAPSIWNPFCVTTDIDYAMEYAKSNRASEEGAMVDPNGFVYAMTIKESLKIFDFQKGSDIDRLKGKWPKEVISRFRPSNSEEYSDPLTTLMDMVMGFMFGIKDDKEPITFLTKRLEKEFPDEVSKSFSPIIYRTLLLKDIKDLGFDGYRASERGGEHSTDNSFVLVKMDGIEKIIPKPIPYEKAKIASDILNKGKESMQPYSTKNPNQGKYDRILIKFMGEVDKL